MKRLLAICLASVMMIVAMSAMIPVGAATLPTPAFFYDFVETSPANSNIGDFFVGGALPKTADGNAKLTAIDGDGAKTDRLFVFLPDNLKLSATKYIVAKFKHDNAAFQPYAANFGLIGKTAGEEKYAKPVYAETTDWQTMIFDVSTDFAGDANYFVWFWHEAADFGFNLELEYIAGFGSQADAEAYAAGYGQEEEPEIGDEVPAPSFLFDFIQKNPADSNLANFYVDGALPRSEDGFVKLTAKDGDQNTDKLQVFLPDNLKLADTKYIVAKFKHDNTIFQPYVPAFGLIGKTSGEEKYAKPSYAETTDWQTMIFDVSMDFTGDAYYLVWHWHEAADFGFNLELAYLAGFKTELEAKAFAKNYTGEPEEPETPDEPEIGDDENENENGSPDTSDISLAVFSTVLVTGVALVVVNKKNRKYN